MKVYLTSTPEFSSEVLTEVELILGQTQGVIEFILGNPLTEQQVTLVNPRMNDIGSDDSISFEELFSLCDTYRIIKEIPNDTFVVLVTSIRNTKNWFSAFKKKPE